VTWKTWAAAGAIPSMNYENTISFLTLVATICGLAFEYFGPEAPESSADARNDKAASQEAPPHCAPLRHTASKHFLVGLFRTPPPGRLVVAAPRAGVRPHSQRTAYTVHKYSYWRWSASSKGGEPRSPFLSRRPLTLPPAWT
jgi:hypothetical protein